MWVNNGRPHMGVITDLRCRIRAKYHNVCKMVLKMDEEISCDMMAEAIKQNDNQDFWKQSKHFQPKNASYPTLVDDAEFNKQICDLVVDKFFNLYNSVSYNNADMEVLRKTLMI